MSYTYKSIPRRSQPEKYTNSNKIRKKDVFVGGDEKLDFIYENIHNSSNLEDSLSQLKAYLDFYTLPFARSFAYFDIAAHLLNLIHKSTSKLILEYSSSVIFGFLENDFSIYSVSFLKAGLLDEAEHLDAYEPNIQCNLLKSLLFFPADVVQKPNFKRFLIRSLQNDFSSITSLLSRFLYQISKLSPLHSPFIIQALRTASYAVVEADFNYISLASITICVDSISAGELSSIPFLINSMFNSLRSEEEERKLLGLELYAHLQSYQDLPIRAVDMALLLDFMTSNNENIAVFSVNILSNYATNSKLSEVFVENGVVSVIIDNLDRVSYEVQCGFAILLSNLAMSAEPDIARSMVLQGACGGLARCLELEDSDVNHSTIQAVLCLCLPSSGQRDVRMIGLSDFMSAVNAMTLESIVSNSDPVIHASVLKLLDLIQDSCL